MVRGGGWSRGPGWPVARPREPGRPSAAPAARRVNRALAGRSLTTADWGYAKPRELLYLFASSPPLTREQVGLALWPELAEGQLRNALHSALRQLRRTLGDAGWVGFAGGRYALDESRPLDCDLREFEHALAEARTARPPAAALSHLQRAIAVYGGDFLAGSAPGDWAVTRRAGLRRAYERALGAAGRLLVADGRVREAVDVYRRAIAHEPLDEAAHRALMECWAASGQTARALRHYSELPNCSAGELGSAQAAQTTALYERLRDAPTELPPRAGLPPAPSVRTPCRWDPRPIPPRFPQRPPRFPPRPRVASQGVPAGCPLRICRCHQSAWPAGVRKARCGAPDTADRGTAAVPWPRLTATQSQGPQDSGGPGTLREQGRAPAMESRGRRAAGGRLQEQRIAGGTADDGGAVRPRHRI